MKTTSIQRFARNFLKGCMDIKPDESMLIVAEDSIGGVAEELWKCARRMTDSSILSKFSYQNSNDHNLPFAIYQSLNHVDTVIVLTPKKVLESTLAKAAKNGARVIVLYDTSNGLLERSLCTSYRKISHLSRRLSDIITIGKTLYLEAANGTSATIPISKLKGIADTGCVSSPGEIMYLPAGEACVLTHHSKIDGLIVLDRLAGQKRKLDSVSLLVKDGTITQIKGKDDAEKLRKQVRRIGISGRKIFEVGIGTNDSVTLGHSAAEDEKALGSIHICIGESKKTENQGKLIESLKGIILKPSVEIDGRQIIRNGKVVF